jgi:hypothetical protein
MCLGSEITIFFRNVKWSFVWSYVLILHSTLTPNKNMFACDCINIIRVSALVPDIIIS